MGIMTPDCPECGARLRVSSGQSISDDGVRWFRSSRCLACGLAVEEDGTLDDRIRNEILRREGDAVLLVDCDDQRLIALIETKRALNMTMNEVRALRRASNSCVAKGTAVELEWLRRRLRAMGIQASVRTTADADSSQDLRER